jgi:hypothetical protein
MPHGRALAVEGVCGRWRVDGESGVEDDEGKLVGTRVASWWGTCWEDLERMLAGTLE